MGIAFCVGYCQIDRKMIFMGQVADYLIEKGVCSDECLEKLEADEQKMHPTLGESTPLNLLSTLEVDSDLGKVPTPTKRR